MLRGRRVALLGLLALTVGASASGPRFVTGPPFFTGQAGLPVGWKQTRLTYSTDPGNLSANVNHAAADALVAAAAGIWNVPVANITVGRGGVLAEHVSGANIFMDSAGLHLPADVMATNAAAVPIAVVYDTDGSVTDTLLGSGASDPSGCRQNAVTESVDAFDPAGYILHALIVINGRCTGPAKEAQLQLQYQLERVFGRVLGLGWSQTNDNVFTGSPWPTAVQAANWPILHPIDIVCGLYTYQCLPSPFTLRIDDISGLVSVYPIPVGSTPAPGKQVSLTGAQGVQGYVTFPTGQGMAGVNVLVRREAGTTTIPDAFYVGSAVTGAYFRQGGVSPFVASPRTATGSMGSDYDGMLGWFAVAYLPLIGPLSFQNVLTSTEPVNPLYVGQYSLGPYAAGTVLPAGSAMSQTTFVTTALGFTGVGLIAADAPAICGTGGDGVRTGPMQAGATGWWSGLLCGYGHASYVQANVKPGHSFTVEVTALDAQGLATENKAMPLVGLYGPADAVGAAPSLGLTPSAFNGRTVGTTSLSASTGTATTIEFGIADARGDGRPDYPYQARLFYADEVTPARISAAGGTLTITGMGFRSGNPVTINGVKVVPLSWTANTITLAAPAMAVVHASGGTALDLIVSDQTTGAVSTLTGALVYDPGTSLPNTMRLVSAPAGTVLVGDVAATLFAVQVLAADGVTPIAGEPVVFSASVGTVLLGACGAAVCTVRTDGAGMASTTVLASAAGAITLQAVDGAMRQTASLIADAQPTAMKLLSVPESSVKEGTGSSSWFQVQLVGADGHTGLAGKPIVFSTTSGSVTYPECSTSPCTILSDAFGLVGMSVTPRSVGPITLKASYGDVKQTASFTSVSNTDTMQIIARPQDTTLGGTALFTIQLLQSNGFSGDGNRRVTFSASAGMTIGECGTAVCELTTEYFGHATVSLYPAKVGTFTVQAAYGSVVQSATFQVTSPARQLKLLSVPADNSATGVVAAVPFSVQLLQPDGVTPMTGVMVSMAGPPGAVNLPACGSPACEIPVDSRGIASVAVVPLLAGNITMSATYAPLVTTAAFKAVGPGETIKFVVSPGAAGAPYGVPQTMTVQVLQADGVTPYNWDQVRISVQSGPFVLLDTAKAAAVLNTDSRGLASCQGVSVGNGMVSIQATDGTVTETITFMSGTSPDVLKVVSAPSGSVVLGSGVSGTFGVQVLGSDGVSALQGVSVTFSVTNGSATLGACGAAVCTVITDAGGLASTSVTATAVGSVVLLAAEANVSRAVGFTVMLPPDVLRLVAAPAGPVNVGIAAGAFTVQLLLGDGMTPHAGVPVDFSAAGAAAQMGFCGAACQVVTNANGMASVAATPLRAGTVTLLAAVEGLSQTVSFQAVANHYSVTGSPAVTYVAEGAVLSLVLSAAVTEDDVPVAGQLLLWTGGVGFVAKQGNSSTDASGVSAQSAVLGPLTGGTSATLTACAWTDTCAVFTGFGVAASQLAVAIVSGGAQAVTGGAAFAPVVAQVTDGAAHPVAGAEVTIYQTVTALDVACPDQGRCPAAPVLDSRVTATTTDAQGRVSLAPLTVGGRGTQTEMAFATGTTGFTSSTLTGNP